MSELKDFAVSSHSEKTKMYAAMRERAEQAERELEKVRIKHNLLQIENRSLKAERNRLRALKNEIAENRVEKVREIFRLRDALERIVEEVKDPMCDSVVFLAGIARTALAGEGSKRETCCKLCGGEGFVRPTDYSLTAWACPRCSKKSERED